MVIKKKTWNLTRQANQPSKEGVNVPQAKEAASGEAGRVRKEFSVSEEWKGQCDQDVISEQASKWTMGRDVAGVGGRASGHLGGRLSR